MSIRRTAIRLTTAGVLTAAGALALGVDQLSALADCLEKMGQQAAGAETSNVDAGAEEQPVEASRPVSDEAAQEEEAAARAEGEGYTLGRTDGEGDPSNR